MEDIVSIVMGECNSATSNDENEDEDDDIDAEIVSETTNSFTYSDAKKSLTILQSYFEQCLHFNSSDLDLLDNLNARLMEQHELNKKQVNLHMLLN